MEEKVKDRTKELVEAKEELEKRVAERTLELEAERNKLKEFYGGIVDLEGVPDALVIIGTHLEDTAVREAISSKVTTVGIVDTNADPTTIDYPIPANDDAVGSIKLITNFLVDAWIEGAGVANKNLEAKAAEEEKEKAIAAAKAKKEKAAAINRKHNS